MGRRLKSLEVENKKLRDQPKGGENGETSPKENDDEEEEAWPDTAELVSAVSSLEKAMGPNHKLVDEAKAELEAARKKRDEAKPMRNKILNFERKVGRQRRSAETAATKAEDLRKAANEAEREAQEATRARDDLQRELASAEQELLRMRQVEIQGVPQPAASGLGDNILGALDPEAVKAATNAEEQELLQQAEIIMARVRKQGNSDSSGNIAAPPGGGSAAENTTAFVPMEVQKLERQPAEAKRAADHAEDRVREPKRSRTTTVHAN